MFHSISGGNPYYSSMYRYGGSIYQSPYARMGRAQESEVKAVSQAAGAALATQAGNPAAAQAGKLIASQAAGAGAAPQTSKPATSQAAGAAATPQTTKQGLSQAAAGAGTAPQTSKPAASQTAAGSRAPVQPAQSVSPLISGTGRAIGPQEFLNGLIDPAELAVRMRIQYDDVVSSKPPWQEAAATGIKTAQETAADGIQSVQKIAVREPAADGVKNVQEAAEKGKCQTCEKRKYQDGSDDMGVSFQTPTRIAPENVASAVRGHEMEHVTREQAKAEREGREVVSQDVILHTSVCPECGKVYISGGTTRTVTAAKKEIPALNQELGSAPNQGQAERRPFLAVA